jgi:hypothetical protein
MRRPAEITPEVAQLRVRMIGAGVLTTYLACGVLAVWLLDRNAFKAVNDESDARLYAAKRGRGDAPHARVA